MTDHGSDMTHLRAQIDQIGADDRRHFDPGLRGVLAAVAVLVLLLATALPFIGSTQGWSVLFGGDLPAGVAGLMPRVFLVLALLFGVVGSLVALRVRRYGSAWVTSLGCDLSIVAGALAVWSQQTGASKAPGPGPGPGMLLALGAMIVLAILWAGITWGRRPDDDAPGLSHGDE